MPSHPPAGGGYSTQVPLNDANTLPSSSPLVPSTPPGRQPPILSQSVTRFKGHRRSTPLSTSTSPSFQEICTYTPPAPTSAQRPRPVIFEELLHDVANHIKEHQGLFTAPEEHFLSHLLLTIGSYPDNYIPDAAPIPATSSAPIPEAIETRLTKQEQTLSHILTRLDQLTSPTTATPIHQPAQKSWANIVEQAASPTTSTTTKASKKRPEPTPEPERTLILMSTTPPTNFNPLQIRDSINNALIQAKLTITVVLVRLSVNNNIVIEVKSGHTAVELKEKQDVWSHLVPGLEEVMIRERWFKLIAPSVSTDLIVADSEEKQMEAFKEDIETYNSELILAAPPRWLTRPEARAGKLHSSLVLSVTTQRKLKYALRNKLDIAENLVKTSE